MPREQPVNRVFVVSGPGTVTTLTDEGARVDAVRMAWQLDDFAAAFAAETAADVRVLDEVTVADLRPGTAVVGSEAAVRTVTGRQGGPMVILLGIGTSTGLHQVEASSVAGGIDFETYRAWQRDPRANDRMFGRLDVAEHMGARIALRSGAYGSFWLADAAGLPRLVARYLDAYAALIGFG